MASPDILVKTGEASRFSKSKRFLKENRFVKSAGIVGSSWLLAGKAEDFRVQNHGFGV